jgi:hypothetical protein
MVLECRRRTPVTIKAEAVESRLDTFFEVRSAAALVTANTPVEASSVSIIVVALETIDRRVFAVREVEWNGTRAVNQRLAQRRGRGTR